MAEKEGVAKVEAARAEEPVAEMEGVDQQDRCRRRRRQG